MAKMLDLLSVIILASLLGAFLAVCTQKPQELDAYFIPVGQETSIQSTPSNQIISYGPTNKCFYFAVTPNDPDSLEYSDMICLYSAELDARVKLLEQAMKTLM